MKKLNLDNLLKMHLTDANTLRKENLNMAMKLHIEKEQNRILKNMVENLTIMIEQLIIKQNQSVDARDELVNTVQIMTNAITSPEIFENPEIQNRINMIPTYKEIEITLKDFLRNGTTEIEKIINQYDKFVIAK